MNIHQLCEKYPGVPRNILIKTEALRLGVTFTRPAREAAGRTDTFFKGEHIFSYDFDAPVVAKEKIPSWFCLKSDDAVVRTGVNSASPYTIDFIDGRFAFCDEGGPAEEVYFDPSPSWVKGTFEDGTPYGVVASQVGKDRVLAYMSHVCDRWARKEQCLFCDIGAHLAVKRQKGTGFTAATPQMVAEVLRAAQRESGIRHLCMTSGSALGKREGKSEVEWFCDYINATNERLNGDWMYSFVAIQPKEKDEVKRLHAAGAPALMINMEVWDERLFNILCPGKAKDIGWREFQRRLIDAVDVFGKGKILSNFVTGVEMARPWGFKDIPSAVDSTLKGFDHLMAHGVLPRTTIWTVESGSLLADQEPPPLEYYIRLHEGYLELRQKHGFPFPFYGMCHGCYLNDTSADWDHYFWGK